MTAARFDAIVIGAGQAGPSLAERFAKSGRKVAIVERKHFGGTCVNTGCVPTKTYVASAYAAHMARRAAEYGVDLPGPVKVDMKLVKARKDTIILKSREGVTRWMEGLVNVTVYRGHARFTGPKTMSVNGDTLTADKIFINTGGRAMVPPMPGLDAVPYFTNTSLLDIDFLPEHLLVVGGSYIGLEFAQAFRRFGSRVTVVEMADRLISREDADVSDAVLNILRDEGIDIRLDAKCLAVKKVNGGVSMSLDCHDGAPTVTGSHLLLAVGRKPNTDDLGLDKAGIETDAKGYIKVDDECRTSVDGVWALGDANGRGAFTHTSYNDYEIVAANLFDDGARRIPERIACYGLFVDPPLGRVGMSETEVKAKGIKALSAKLQMTSIGRARERGETKRFMKVLVEAGSGKILGATILGLNGDEVVQSFLTAMGARVSFQTISRTMYIHPTVAEYLPTLLEGLKPLE